MPKDVSVFVQALISKMTLTEKIGQLQQSPYYSDVVTGHDLDASGVAKNIIEGKVGSILSVHNQKTLKELQTLAVSKSRLGIPLLFCFDVIHGYKTGFPINLALAHSFDVDLIERVSEAVAFETSHAGLHLTFSPMVDIVRDPRWGRVMESNGEDPYLSSELAKAYVKGYQGDDLESPHRVAACVKHFAGYGFAEAGRDYNTVDISKRVLWNTVIPPFKAAIDAGVSMVMTSFNTVFDVPATANKVLLKDILRDALEFKNVVISDFSSTEEIIDHKVAVDLKDVALQCFNAGVDMEMGSTSFHDHLESLMEEGTVLETDLDEAVIRLLTLKANLGLFENPFRNFYDDSDQYMQLPSTKAIALEAAEKSMVLLKNEGVLPLKPSQKIAVVGAFSDSNDLVGEWPGLIQKNDVVTLRAAFEAHSVKADYFTTLESLKGVDLTAYERVLLLVGEASNESGEGYSKADINLSALDLALLEQVKHHPDVISVVFSGRPLILTPLDEATQAILVAYMPGTEAGHALYNLLYGVKSPSGKLVMTYPRHQGQVPIYYNHYQTGRPLNPKDPMYRYRSHYIDQPNDPLYPFGFGLNYGDSHIKTVIPSSTICDENTPVVISLKLSNDGNHPATEVVQCYIEAVHYSVSRPVNELKRFKRIHLKPGETTTLEFTLSVDDFRAYNMEMKYTAEERPYKVKLGTSSKTTHEFTVDVKDFIY